MDGRAGVNEMTLPKLTASPSIWLVFLLLAVLNLTVVLQRKLFALIKRQVLRGVG